MGLYIFAFILIILLTALVVRALFLIYKVFSEDCQLNRDGKSLKTLICIGSGGHTSEMLRVVPHLNAEKYQPRLYVLAETDVTSEVKIHQFENGSSNYFLCKIPRSRNVQQSYFSSIFSTLNATFNSIPVVYKYKPRVILCNGPGTCVPICVVAFIFRCMYIIDCRIVFIESLCRVRTLSLSGKILQLFADVFIVQWPQLRDSCLRAKYFGRLT